MDEGRARKLAANEALARDVNERVEEVAGAWADASERMEFICECSRDTCTDRVHVSIDEYRAVRQNEQRFLLRDAHVVEEIERRVGSAGDATVVEKIGPGRDVVSAEA